MRGNDRLPDDQAEIVFSEAFLLYLDNLTTDERESVLAEVVALCDNPIGKHPLSNRSATDRLAGLNTVEVLGKKHRVVFCARVENGVGLVEVICAGPRTGNAVYDVANALVRSGRLTEAEATQIWDALALLDVVAEGVGIDGWDYRPRPAEAHLVRALVQLQLLPEDLAATVSRAEAEAAMRDGYDAAGQPDPDAALAAVLRAARTRSDYGDATDILRRRSEKRCGAEMPRARATCIRRVGHPGPHRATG
ncbi:hypothetical protein IU500_33975 [Nocardia terpenica]|uniref:hypothetical protein n=1 Tax=Nocardia terpenica TaxID=455432 RepID=UPI001896012F|nr:hypothetical protein [Nocardia terpenica]MBF6066048.1 hypothetical protein [Nocardia terpenica]MBF6109025.1 hypothetical protein [Nocardia terpenica]MBF6116292.1 hypothetical protein [Nocardia terpenica]MBF6123293.1 hypothetical protein [Nocardia terpenica]MBF6156524.1 hypothetical protein [Nocardia terpenica]